MGKKPPYEIDGPDRVNKGLLETIDYLFHDKRRIHVIIEQPEFTSVCPMTGLPDFGTIKIAYTPFKKIVELKSLKYYLLQYRNVGIFYEHLVNRILDDLVEILEPVSMTVAGSFTARGGITTNVEAKYEKKI